MKSFESSEGELVLVEAHAHTFTNGFQQLKLEPFDLFVLRRQHHTIYPLLQIATQPSKVSMNSRTWCSEWHLDLLDGGR